MIKNFQDYLRYLDADKRALHKRGSLKELLFDDVWAFQRRLRKAEYLNNCSKNPVRRLIALYRLRSLGTRLGFSIPINVFGPGLAIAHTGTIVVNKGAKIGANCRIHVCVNIGTAAGKSFDAPTIGDNVYIGPGAKLFGLINIGDRTVIGANAVVNKSFQGGFTIGGIPARVISSKDSTGLLPQDTPVG
jgi:serine O-acetyltransferase